MMCSFRFHPYRNRFRKVCGQHPIYLVDISNSVSLAPEMELAVFRGGIILQKNHLCAERNVLAFPIHFNDQVPFHIKGRIVQSGIVIGLEEGKIADGMQIFRATLNGEKFYNPLLQTVKLRAFQRCSVNSGLHRFDQFHVVGDSADGRNMQRKPFLPQLLRA